MKWYWQTSPLRLASSFQDPDAQICTLNGRRRNPPLAGENRGIDPTEIALRVENEFLALHLDVGLDDPIETLSEGQKQLVMLASILASRPRLLILDEPLSNLDAEISQAHVVDRVLEAHRSGVVVVVIDHRMDAWPARGQTPRCGRPRFCGERRCSLACVHQ